MVQKPSSVSQIACTIRLILLFHLLPWFRSQVIKSPSLCASHFSAMSRVLVLRCPCLARSSRHENHLCPLSARPLIVLSCVPLPYSLNSPLLFHNTVQTSLHALQHKKQKCFSISMSFIDTSTETQAPPQFLDAEL